jgi:hypothetical protein
MCACWQADNASPLQATRRTTAVLAPAFPTNVGATTQMAPLAPRLATLQKELQRQSSLIQRCDACPLPSTVCVYARALQVGPDDQECWRSRAPLLSSRYVYATRDIATGREGELQVRRGDLIRIVHDSSDVWYRILGRRGRHLAASLRRYIRMTGQVEDRVGWVPKAATSEAPPPDADDAAVGLAAAAATTHYAASAAPRVLIGEGSSTACTPSTPAH